MSILDRFTKRAKQVLYYAQEEAHYFNHPYVGTEHILLGLIRDKDHVAGKVLDALGLKHARAREAVDFIVGHGEKLKLDHDLELSAKGKKVIEYAIEEANNLNHQQIGTEHFLLGLLRLGEGVAAGVLEILSVDAEQVRTVMLRELQQVPKQDHKPKPRTTPSLDTLSIDLTAKVATGTRTEIIGRQTEIERLIQISSRLSKNNTVLIGEAGAGKASVVEGLAQHIVAGDVPESIKGKRVVKLDTNALMNGLKHESQLEERLKGITDELHQSRSILFINELYLFPRTNENNSDLVKLLKLVLGRGVSQVVVAATPDEYAHYIEHDPLLKRHFQSITVNELTIDETIEMLRSIKSHYENFHQLHITDEAIKAAVHLSVHYVHDRLLPDKAIDLVDEACTRVQTSSSTTSALLRDARRSLDTVRKEYQSALEDGDFELVLSLRGREDLLLERITQIESEELKRSASTNHQPSVTKEDIADVVAIWTGTPISNITTDAIIQIKDVRAAAPPAKLDTKSSVTILPAAPHKKPVRVFYSYSHRDKRLRDRLETHLALLRNKGIIEEWSDRNISAGQDWKKAIGTNLEAADIILLLISADFLASDYCYNKEMTRALQKHDAGEAHVIPIILHNVDWHDAPFGHLQALPTGAKPVTRWSNREDAWANVANGIRKAVEQINAATNQ